MNLRMRRMVVGSLVVAALVALPPESKVLQKNAGEFDIARDVPSLVVEEFRGGSSLEHALQMRLNTAEVPDSFEDELFFLSDAQNLLIDDGAGVISFQTLASPVDTFNSLKAFLKQNGWQGLSSEGETVGTFVKAAGEYRWACLSCGEVSGRTVVVIQVERAKG